MKLDRVIVKKKTAASTGVGDNQKKLSLGVDALTTVSQPKVALRRHATITAIENNPSLTTCEAPTITTGELSKSNSPHEPTSIQVQCACKQQESKPSNKISITIEGPSEIKVDSRGLCETPQIILCECHNHSVETKQ